MSDNRSDQERFDSWKEIATYLNRDVRTVIRWEKERGLPVRRVPGGHKQAVFAYREEIDAWLGLGGSGGNHSDHAASARNGGTNGVAHLAPEQVRIPAMSEDAMPEVSRWRARIKKMMAAAILCGILGIGAVVLYQHRAPAMDFRIVRIPIDPKSQLAVWIDGATVYFADRERGRQVLRYAPMSGHPVQTLETPFANLQLLDFSRDGKTLLVSPYEGTAREKKLWAIPVDGGTPRQLGNALCHDARWSPNNQWIACATMTSVLLLDAAGMPLGSIGSFPSEAGILAWSPDGKRLRIASTDEATQNYNAWEIDVSKGPAQASSRELPWGAHCTNAAWTRDGRFFVYLTLEPGGRQRMFVRHEDALWGASQKEIPLQRGGIAALQADRLSNRVYFNVGTADFRGELLRLDPGKHEFQPFIRGLVADNLAFSRDGQWLAYIDPVDKSLWRSRRDGSEAMRLTSPPMEAMLPSWSPDGKWIAFSANEPEKSNRIFVIGRDGGPLRVATQSPEPQGAPSWSPDGRSIVYGDIYCELTATCWVRTADLASRKSKIIPGSHGFRTARWSPDGKYIAAIKQDTQELMLYDRKTGRWKSLAGEITGDNLSWSSDSRFLFADCPSGENPRIERIRVRDGSRTTVASLLPVQQARGEVYDWFGLTPDESVVISHFTTATELYALEWKTR